MVLVAPPNAVHGCPRLPAVAPDLRGYGDTTGARNGDFTEFTTLHVVGDLVELLNIIAPDQEKVFVVGHDWGAMIAWAMCLYRPDKVKALVNMSVAFVPRNPIIRPIAALRSTYGDDYYIIRFQEPGDIEEEFAQIGTKTVLEKLLTNRNPEPLMLPKGKPFEEGPVILPPWLTEKDVDYYASTYDHTGFTGGLNYYRALDPNWELTAPWTGQKISTVPVKFIVGDLDATYNSAGVEDYIHKGGFKKDVTSLEEVVILKGVAHFLQQEKPHHVNNHIHVFFQGLYSSD